MENTAEGDDDLSSMADHSPAAAGSSSSSAAAVNSEESGWTTYIDYFLATQQQRFVEEASSCSACTSPSTNADVSSKSVGDDGAGGGGAVVASFAEASRLPALVDPSSEASRRWSLRRKKDRRMKLMRRDEYLELELELEDTATSPISSPKLIGTRNSDDSHKKKEDACDDISHISKKASDELDFNDYHINNIIENGEDTSTDMISHNDAYEHNQLSKEGHCLVSMSVFHALL